MIETLNKNFIYSLKKLNIYKMKARWNFVIYIMMILLNPAFYIYGKPLPKFSKHQTDKESLDKKNQRNLQSEEYDSYIVIHYRNESNYPNGFKNDFRNNISFIINRRDNSTLTDQDELNITAGTEIEIHFNSSVKNMENFFSQILDKNMANVVSIDFSNFDSSNLQIMKGMFSECNSLESLDLSNLNTSFVSTMSNLFSGCSSIKSLDLSSFDTSLTTDMSGMFNGCYSLIYLDISNFDMGNCDSFNNTFSNISSIKYINLFNFSNDKIIVETFNNVDNLSVCQKENIITNPNIYNCCNYNIETGECNLNYVTLSFIEDFETDNCWYYEIKNYILYVMNGEEQIYNFENNFTINANDSVQIYFKSGLTRLDFFLKVNKFDYDNPCINSFEVSSRVKTIDLSHLDTSSVAIMESMFENYYSLEYINFTNFNTSKVETMKSMFYQCNSLQSIDLINFDTSNVKTMAEMFYGCYSLISINLSSFDTSLVTSMEYLFYECSSLETIDLSPLNTSKTNQFNNMFVIALH